MDKEIRNAIERATQRARTLLADDFAAQLEGTFDVQRSGAVAPNAGLHLGQKQVFQRDKIVAAIEHKRAVGMSVTEAVADYLRDAAFTTLNRFVALKMLEERGLVQECITKGELSAGYREFCGMAPGVVLLPESAGYRLYIESLFDELSTEVKVLFDRRDPASVLWPKRATFEALLETLNATDLMGVWGEDETVGWVYQYFNAKEERAAMRDTMQGGSQAPRNSRELAIRNQFFTPSYVVKFLTDNTLGRIWYEMRGGQTALVERCEYMVRQPEELHTPLPKKDPRDLRVLDPACGSGHFLLYAFDLLVEIYEEAYGDSGSPKSEATGNTLAADYPTIDALRCALPALVLAGNLHGVDIDPRCVQIAQLAIWMRAQRVYREFGIPRGERPLIRRSNIVVAEPLVTDEAMLKEFLAKLEDAELSRVFTELVETMKRAGDFGLLLHVERLISRGQMSGLFEPPEARIRVALGRFVAKEGQRASARRHLFADDAAQGVGLLEIAEKRFDVVLMNPPFGDPLGKLSEEYKGLPKDLYCCFVERASTLLQTGGRVGALTSASFRTYIDYESYRARFFVTGRVPLMADLGWGVLDGAYVDTAAYVIGTPDQSYDFMTFIDVRDVQDRARVLKDAAQGHGADRCYVRNPRRFESISGMPLIYWWSDTTWDRLARFPRLGSVCESIGKGAGPHAIFYRLRWEVPPNSIGLDRRWLTFTNGGSFSPFRREDSLLIHWENGGALVKGYLLQRYPYLNGNTEWNVQMEDHFGRPGLTYGKKTSSFSAQVMPAGSIFSFEGIGVFPATQVDAWWLLAYMNSEFVRWYLNATCGLHKNPPYVRNVPVPTFGLETKAQLADLAKAGWAVQLSRAQHDERTTVFTAPWRSSTSETKCDQELAAILATIDAIVEKCIGLSIKELRGASASSSRLTVVEPDSTEDADLNAFPAEDAYSWLSWAVGVAFGRFDIELANSQVVHALEDPFAALPISPCLSGARSLAASASTRAVFVDDLGHQDDLTASVAAILAYVNQPAQENLARFLRRDFSALHIKMYSKNRRKAPIYWQLATSSGTYSVWLYLHALTKDTIYKVQNDYVTPKLSHEERRLESLRRERGVSVRSADRKTLAAQESLVDELRAFLDEIKRVAPLWNPDLDDGVIITFAPLWRLVPHNKQWQREVKATWDGLCAGTYDWAHLAMHLWPERVVPKCARDRSIAIAHGLEDVFWVEDVDGKWKARATPLKTVEELVRERSSLAVKAALKSLLDAPTASGTGRASGRRIVSAAATQRGSR